MSEESRIIMLENRIKTLEKRVEELEIQIKNKAERELIFG
jgi:hypothetical protein